MPMRNPFRRPTEAAAPSLRERATTLRDRFASAIRNVAPEPQPEPKSGNTIEDFAGIEFRAYDFDLPIKTPQEWTGEFADRALMLHLADRTLRMTKPELMAFIREAGERDASTPEIMFRGFDGAQETLNGWSNLLKLARDRYIVAASAECLEPVKEGNDEPKAIEPLLAAPVANAFAPRLDLAAVLLDGWATWRTDLDKLPREDEPGIDQRVDATAAPMNRLIQTAAALPATPENITAKALACAWMEWVHAERPDQPRDAYGPADQLVFDINATIMEHGSQGAASWPASSALPAFDFGPDAHIAELAAEFCEAYAANIKADREHMAERMPEAEWLPHYRRAAGLMEKLEATEPKTLLGMALKCLGPIGAAGYNAPADDDEVQADAWDRVGTQFANAVLRGDLTPLPTADWHASPVDLIAAAGLSVETLPVSDLCSMLDAAKILSNVAAAITCQPRQMTKGNFNGAGRLIEDTAFALHRAIDVVARELRQRAPDNKHDQTCRLAALASLTIHNDDETETAALARELLAMVEP